MRRAVIAEVREHQGIEALALEFGDRFVFLTKFANAYEIEWSETIERSMQKAEARWNVIKLH